MMCMKMNSSETISTFFWNSHKKRKIRSRFTLAVLTNQYKVHNVNNKIKLFANFTTFMRLAKRNILLIGVNINFMEKSDLYFQAFAHAQSRNV